MTEPPPKRLAGLVKAAWSAAGTGVAVVASIVALAFTLVPGLSPDPHTGLTASLSISKTEPGVTLRDFHMRFYPKDVKDDPPNGPPGAIVFVEANVHGEKHGEVKLYPVVYDATVNRAAFPDPPVPSDSGRTPFIGPPAVRVAGGWWVEA